MKNADLRKFESLVVGERFVGKNNPNDWLIKVGNRDAVFMKDVIPYAGDEPVYTKRGQAVDFLREAREVLNAAKVTLTQVGTVLERFVGGDVIEEKPAEVVAEEKPKVAKTAEKKAE